MQCYVKHKHIIKLGLTSLLHVMYALTICLMIFAFTLHKIDSKGLKVNHYNVEHDLKSQRLLSCTTDIIYNYCDKRTLILFKSEIHNSVGERLIKSASFAYSIVTSLLKGRLHGFYILQPPAGITINYTKLLQYAHKASLFLIIWNENSTMLDVERVFDQMWNLHILRVISVVPLSHGDPEIYLYFPYSVNHCNRAGIPVKVCNCKHEHFSKTIKLFSTANRLKNFYQCPLNAVGNNQPPEITLFEDKNGVFQTDGGTISLLNIFKNYLNFSLNIINVYEDRGGWFFYNDSVISRMLVYKNKTIDFGFGSFSLLELNSYPNLDYAFPIFPECFSWAVPHHFGDHPSIWANFVKEFSPVTWINLVLAYLIANICIHFISRKLNTENIKFQEVSTIMIFLFGLIVGQAFTVVPKTQTLKLFLILWATWMLAIHTAYEASLGSFMTVPTPVQDIKSTKEIIEKGLRIASGVRICSFVKEFAANNKAMKIKSALEKIEILPPNNNSEEIFDKIYKQRNLAVLFPKRYINHFGGNSKFIESSEKVYIIPECVVRTYAYPLISRKDTPISYAINNFLLIIFQSGLTKYLRLRGKLKAAKFKIDPKKCTLKHLQGAFTIFALGHLLASLCFLGELFFSKIVKK